MGPARHLALLAGISAPIVEWPVPFAEGLARLLAHRGRPVVVLADSGGAASDVQHAVRNRETRELMEVPLRPPNIEYHLFLSHVWSTGQDSARRSFQPRRRRQRGVPHIACCLAWQARVIKERLKQLVHGISVFLDASPPRLEP